MARLRLIAALRELFAGGRLLISTVAATLLFLSLPADWRLPVRLAAAWDVGAVLFLGLTELVAAHARPERVRHRARQLDSRRWVILGLIITAAMISLLALGFTLHKAPDETPWMAAARVVLTGITVVASWTLAHVTFALHYAHHFYGDGPAPGEDDRGGLAFPGGEPPDYWDFLYFSLVVGMTCQVSDVQVTSRAMRRLTLLHGVLAFFFNTVILALAVNLLASSL